MSLPVQHHFLSVSLITRSQAKKANVETKQILYSSEENFLLAYLFQSPTPTNENLPLERRERAERRPLMAAQKADESLTVPREEALAESEGPRSKSKVY